MKTTLSYTNPAESDTECLAVVMVDRGEKDKPAPAVLDSNQAVQNAASDLLTSGEVSGKLFETVMVHRPQGLKARDRKSTRLNSSHLSVSRMPSSA